MVYEFENGPRNLEKLTSKEMDEARKKIQIVFSGSSVFLKPVLYDLPVPVRSR